MIILNIPIEPVPKGRPRFNRKTGVAYTPEKTRAFSRAVKAYAIDQYKGKPLEGAIAVTIVHFIKKPKTVKREYPIVKPDLDNLNKAVLDSLNGVLWDDDSQVIEINSSKKYNPVGGIFLDVRPYHSSF